MNIETLSTPSVKANELPPSIAPGSCWMPSMYLHRVADQQGFDWLSKLRPGVEGTPAGVAQAFGIHLAYLHHDVLTHYPRELVLSLPSLRAPPVDHFFVCTSKGQRWFWVVVLRRNATASYGLVFEVSPMVLMLPITGLRDQSGTHMAIQYRPEVLAPMDGQQIWCQKLNPSTGEYFVVHEMLSDGPQRAGQAQTPQAVLAEALGLAPSTQPTAQLEFSVGSPAFCMPIQVNTDAALLNLVASMGPHSGQDTQAGGAL